MAMSSEIGSPRLAVHLPSNPPPRGMRPASASARVCSHRPSLERRLFGDPASARFARPSPPEGGELAPGYVKYTGELDVWVPCDQTAGEPADALHAPALRDLAQAIFELRTGMATRKDVERLVAEVKTEVKTEASVLRQKFTAAMHPTASDGRTMRRLGGGLEAPDLGGSSTDLKSMESSIAGILRTLQEVISPKIAGLNDVVREVKAVNDTVREMQVCTPLQASADVSSVSEEVRKLRTSVTELTAMLEPPRIGELTTPRSTPLQPHFMVGAPAGLSGAGRRASGHAEGLARATEAASAEEARAEDPDSNPVLAAIKESRMLVLRELRDAAKRHETDAGMIAAAVRGTAKPAADVTALAMELRQLQPQVRAEVTGAVSAIKEAADSLAGELAQRITAAAGDARELLAAVRESQAFDHKTGMTGEIKQLQAQAEFNRQELLAAVQESKASDVIRDLRESLAELRSKSEESSTELLKALQRSKAQETAGSLEASRAAQEGKELRELHSRTEKNCAELLSAVQELHSKSEQRNTEVLKAVQESKELHSQSEQRSAEVLKAVQESKASEAVSGLSQELRELHGKAERRSAEVLEAVQQGKAAGEPPSVARELQQLRSQAELNVGEVLAAVRDSQALDGQAGVVRDMVRELLAKNRTELLEALQLRESKAGEEGKRVLESIKQLQLDLDEVKERRPEAYLAPVVGELRQLQSQVAGDCSSVLQAVRDGKLKVDLSPVLKAIELTKPEVDTTVLLKAIRAVKTEVDFSEVLQAIHEAKKTVDFSPVLRAVREHSPEVDFAPVMQALRSSSRTSPDLSRGLQDVLQAVTELKEGKLQMDCTPVVKEVQRSESSILGALAEGRVDFSVVTKKIEENRPKVDFQAEFSQLTRTVHAHKPEVDFSPVLAAIDESRTALEASRSLKDLRQQLRELSEGSLQVDFAPLIKEVRQVHSQSASGTATLLAALEEVKTGSSGTSKALEQSSRLMTEFLDGRVEADAVLLRQTQSQVDACSAAVIAAVRETAAANASQAEEHTLRATKEVDTCSAAVIAAVRETAAANASQAEERALRAAKEVDACSTAVIAAVRESAAANASQAEERALRAAKEVDACSAAVIAAVQETAAANASQADERALRAAKEVDAGSAAVIAAVRESAAATSSQAEEQTRRAAKEVNDGSAAVIAAVRESVAANATRAEEHVLRSVKEVDLSPVLEAIESSRAALESSESIKEIRKAVAEIRAGKLDIDLSPVVAEVQQKHSLADTQLLAIQTCVQEGKVDLSPVLEAIRENRTALESSQSIQLEVRKAVADIKEGKVDLDLSPILKDIELKHGLLEAQFSALRTSIEKGKVEVDVPKILQSIEQSKTEVDLLPVLQAIDDAKAALDCCQHIKDVKDAVMEIKEGKASLRVSGFEEKISAVHRAVDAGKTEVDLSPVLAAIDDAKAALDCSERIKQMTDALADIKDGKLELDFSAILGEVREKHDYVAEQFAASRKATTDTVPEILKAIETSGTKVSSKLDLDFACVLSEIQQKHNSLEEQFLAIRRITKDAKEAVDMPRMLEAIERSRTEVDFSPVMAAIHDCKSSLGCSEHLKEVKELIAEVRDGKLGIEISATLAGVEEKFSRVEEHFSAICKAVITGGSLEDRKEVDLSPVLRAISDSRTALDFSRHMREIKEVLAEAQQRHHQVDEHFLAVHKAIADGKVDLSPVLAAVADHRKAAALESSQRFQEVKDAVAEVKVGSAACGEVQQRLAEQVSSVRKSVEEGKGLATVSEMQKRFEEHILAVRKSVEDGRESSTVALSEMQQQVLAVRKVVEDGKEGSASALRDVQQRLEEGRQGQAALGEMRQRLEEQFLALHKAVEEGKQGSSALREMQQKLQEHLLAIQKAVEKEKEGSAATLCEVQQTLEGFLAVRKAVEGDDTAKILKAIEANKPEVDLSPVLGAIEKAKTAVDCSQHIQDIKDALAEVKEDKWGLDISAVLGEVRMQHKRVEEQLMVVKKAMEERMEALGVPKILAAVEGIKTEVDLSPVLDAIKESKALHRAKEVKDVVAEVNLSAALGAIQKQQSQVEAHCVALQKTLEDGREDLPRILQAIESNRTQVDLSPVLAAIGDTKASQHIKEIKDIVAEVNFSAVLSAIQQTHTEVGGQYAALRKAIDDGREDAPKILKAVETSRTEAEQKHCQVDERLLAISKAVEDGSAPAHVPRILEAIEASRTEAEQKHCQVDERLAAIGKAVEDGSAPAHVPRILEAIEASRTEAQQKHCRVEERLLVIGKAVEDGSAPAHVPKILEAIEASKTEAQQKHCQVEERLWAISKAVEDGSAPAHVPKILEAIEVSKTEAQKKHCQVEERLLAISKAVEDGSAPAHVPKILEAIEASKTEAQQKHCQVEERLLTISKAVEDGSAPAHVPKILEAIEASKAEAQQKHCQVEERLLAIGKAVEDGSAPAHVPKILEAIEASKTEVQQKHSQVEERLSAVNKAVEDGSEPAFVSKILKAIQVNKTEVDLLPLLAYIEDSKAALNSLEHLKEIREGVADIRKGKVDLDFSAVLNELQERSNHVERRLVAIHKSVEDGREALDAPRILKAIETSKTEVRDTVAAVKVDCSQQIKEVKDALAEVKEGKLDFSALLDAFRERSNGVERQLIGIRKALEDGVEVVDVPKIVSAIEASKTEVDLSPVLAAIKDNRAALDGCSQGIKAVGDDVAEVRKGKLHLDFSAVLNEFQERNNQVERQLLAIRKAVEDGREVDLSPVLAAVGDTKSALNLSQHTIEEIKDALADIKRGKLDLDFSAVLNEFQERHNRLERQLLAMRKAIEDGKLHEVQERHKLVEEELQAIRRSVEDGKRVEVPRILQAIETSRAEVDLSPVFAAIHENKIALDCTQHFKELKATLAEITEGKLGLQDELEVHLRAVRQSLEDGKVDLSPVLGAINDTRTALESSQSIKEVREAVVQVDLSPVLEAIREARAALDCSQHIQEVIQVVAEVRGEIRRQLRGGEGEVTLLPVLEAIEETKITLEKVTTLADIKKAVAEIKESKAELELLPILNEMQRKQGHVEEQLSAVLNELQRRQGQVEVQLSAVRRAVEDGKKAEVDVPRMLQTLEMSRTKADLSPVLAAINDTKAASVDAIREVAAEVMHVKQDVDFSPVLSDAQQKHGQVEAQLSAVRKAIQDGAVDVDVPRILAAIEANRTEVDFSPVLAAISETRAASANAIREVVAEVREGRSDITFSSILSDIQQKHRLLEEQLSALRSAIRQGQGEVDAPQIIKVDFSPVLAAVEDCKVALNCSQHFQEIMDGVTDIKRGKLDLDFSVVLNEFQERNNQVERQLLVISKAMDEGREAVADMPKLLGAIEASKTEVVAAVGTARTEVDFSVVLKELESNKLEAALVHSIDGKVTAQAHLLSGLLTKLDDVVGRHEELRLWCLRTMREPSPRGVQQPQVTSTWRPAAASSGP